MFQEYFVVPEDSKNAFHALMESASKSDRRVNVLFTIGYYNANYYYLAQLLCLSKLFVNKNTFFYIILSDTDIVYKRRKGASSTDELFLIEKNISELKNVLISFGVPESNIFVYKLSEVLVKMIEKDKLQVINLFHGLIRFPIQELKMPNWMPSLQYRPKNYQYTLAYAFRVFCDVLFSKNFHNLYQEDIPDKIHIYIGGYGGSPLILKIRNLLVKEGLVDKLPTIVFTMKLPVFGRGELVKGSFSIPDWSMDQEEILGVINTYKVKPLHITMIFELLLNKFLSEFYCYSGSSLVKSSNTPSLKNLAIKRMRKLLAYNLWLFLTKVKKEIYMEKEKTYLEISEKQKIKDIAALLRSKIVLDIISLANGEYTISQIAKKLNKQDSNISRIISLLKEKEIIRINENKKVEKGVTTIKLSI